MIKRLLIEERGGTRRTAVLEDDRLKELFIDREENGSIVGQIILGTVKNVLTGNVAFVDIGHEKNALKVRLQEDGPG